MINFANIRILAIPSAIGLSHLTRLVLIARELREHGAEVAFAYRDGQEAILRLDGFSILPVADAVVTDFRSNIYAAFTPKLIEACIQDELSAIQTFKPDLILGDFRLTAAISASISQIPYVSVVNGALTDYLNPVEVMRSKIEDSFKWRLTSFVVRIIQGRQKKSVSKHFRAAARKHGVKHLNSLFDFLAGDLTLIADLPEFCPLNELPATYRYIGPLIWEGDPKERVLLPFDLQKPIIYATTGNTGQKQLIELLIEAFGDNDAYQVMLTTGAFIAPESIPQVRNIYVRRFIPGWRVVPLAQAVIHCGGSGTTYQALTYGKAALVIPFNNEQRINAWLVKKHQVGIPLSPARLTGKEVEAKFKELIAEIAIEENLLRFYHLLQRIDGPLMAVEEIISFLAKS